MNVRRIQPGDVKKSAAFYRGMGGPPMAAVLRGSCNGHRSRGIPPTTGGPPVPPFLIVALLGASAMFRVGELLLFHENADQLRQRRDLLILNTDDGKQLKNNQEEEDADTDQGQSRILNLQP